jgi:hypothetical protein
MLVVGIGVFIILCFPLILVAIQLFTLRTASTFTFGSRGLDLISGIITGISGFNYIAMLPLIVLFILGIAQMCSINKNKCIFLILITIFTFAVSYIISLMIPLEPRHIIWFSLVFFLGIACSYRTFYTLFRRPAVVYGFIAVLCIITIPFLLNYYSEYSKPDWRGFSGLLQEKTTSGDVVVAVPAYNAQPLDYYYSSVKDDTREYGATTSQDLKKIYSQKGNSTMYVVVTTDISPANPEGDAIAWLTNNTHYIGQDSVIYLFGTS